MHVIYQIINKCNRMRYVGQTKDYNKRVSRHKRASININDAQYNLPLYRAIRKYGWGNFIVGVLLKCEDFEANRYEQHYIKNYNSLYPEGYNLESGGSKNKVFSKLALEKMSKAQLKRFSNPNEREKLRQSQLKRLEIPEERKKLGELHEFNKFRMRDASTKLYQDPDSQLKISLAKGGKKFNVYKNDNIIRTYINQMECSRDLHISCGNIWSCLHNRRKQANGYTFKFVL